MLFNTLSWNKANVLVTVLRISKNFAALFTLKTQRK